MKINISDGERKTWQFRNNEKLNKLKILRHNQLQDMMNKDLGMGSKIKLQSAGKSELNNSLD